MGDQAGRGQGGRVFVVGLGAVTCLGSTLEETWAGLIAGRSGLKRHESMPRDRFLQDIAGVVETFQPGPAEMIGEAAKLEVRSIHFALEAAREAWRDAGLHERQPPSRDGFDPDRVGVLVGSALGGMDLFENEVAKAAKRTTLAVSPYLIPGLIINQEAGQIARQLGVFGPGFAPANACASGGHAVALGGMMIRAGEIDLALCGASESALTPMIVNGFATMKALYAGKPGDRAESDPSQASRPFSGDRAGFVLAEGAGMIVLASETAVERMGLRPHAELLAWAVNSDGHHMAMPHGARIEACLRTALDRSGLEPEAIGHYNAHGTSTKVNDRVETQAIKAVFGSAVSNLAVASIKGALGHALGAASAIEAAVAVRSLSQGIVPPTLNYQPDPELDLDFVPHQARRIDLSAVMSASFGFGGTNNALIFGRIAS